MVQIVSLGGALDSLRIGRVQSRDHSGMLVPNCIVSPCLAIFALVVLAGCGGSHATSTQQATPATPPPPAAGVSARLTPAGYAALRDSVAVEHSLERSRLSPTSRLAKLRASCYRLGNAPNNRQVQAQRAQCSAGVEEASIYLAFDNCRKAADVPARRACVLHELQLLAVVLRRENSLDNDLVAAIGAGPCRNLLLVGYRENAQVADASDRAARAVQTAKAANDARGPLQAWARALAAMFTAARREDATLKSQFPVCRPQ